MALTRLPALRLSFLVLILSVSTVAFAADVATMSVAGGQLSWSASAGYESIELIVSAPDGQIYTKRFSVHQNPSFSLSDLGGGVTDGVYNYELRMNPKVGAQVAQRLKAAREAGDDVTAGRILKEAGIAGNVQSGSFSISNGALVSPGGTESAGGARQITTNARPTTPVTNDQVIPDDLIVQGSACVGLDCVNNENFGFDTIRLKENNLRIHFDDTSASAGFPANDWRLIANDSTSGGSNKFSIEDSTGAKTPFTVTAGALTNSIFVDSLGRVGFRTSTPVLDLHVNTSNTPALRLEQNSSGGFTAQTWDIGANEANFFVRDVTGGSKLSFRIRPGAPTSSIDISADGDVGVGTGSPTEKLHVVETVDANTFMVVENSNASGTSAAGIVRAKADTAVVNFQAHGTARTVSRFGVTLGAWTELLTATGNGLAMGTVAAVPVILGTNSTDRLHLNGSDNNVGISCNAPTFDLVIASGGGCSNPASNINAGATQFTVTSSRTYKENLEPLDVPDLLDKMEKVGVYRYDFKQGPKDRLGLMAEDFHEIFGRGDEKLLDGNDVQMALWMAVQKLATENKALVQRLEVLEKSQPK